MAVEKTVLPDEGQLTDDEFAKIGARIGGRMGIGGSSGEAAEPQPDELSGTENEGQRVHTIGPLPLLWSVTFQDRRIEKIYVEPPRWSDMTRMMEGTISLFSLYEIMVGEGEGFFDVLRGDDIDRVLRFARSFVPAIAMPHETDAR